MRIPAFLILALCVLAGCATRPDSRLKGIKEEMNWKGQQLYLQAAPHRKLYVEINAVEGCQPSEALLGDLREFLAAHCDKPDGIEIVRQPLIPAAVARGISPVQLVRHYLQGPPTNASGEDPA